MARMLPSRAAEEDPRVVRLLGLLLVDAFEAMGRGRAATGSREAREWVCSRSNGVYSFERACDTFGLPPELLRRRLGLRAQAPRRRTTRGWMRPQRR